MLKKTLQKLPKMRDFAAAAHRSVRGRFFEGSARYWENRYASGGNSGAGSYGRLAHYKASVINAYIREHGVRTVLELGCGDGNQLARLEGYERYVGLDVSKSAIERCLARHGHDPTKSFFLYSPNHFHDRGGLFVHDMTMSLDVIYHLVEDDVFDAYMRDLFACARAHVIIYSSDVEGPTAHHVRDRRFTDWVTRHAPEWTLVEKIDNPYKMKAGDLANTSRADFHFFRRRKAAR